jgi:hypothetical protein
VGSERRKHTRYTLRRQVTVRLRNHRTGAWTVDVSKGGIMLKMHDEPRPGEVIEVEMETERAVMITPARVCHVRRHSDGALLVGAVWMPADSRIDLL